MFIKGRPLQDDDDYAHTPHDNAAWRTGSTSLSTS